MIFLDLFSILISFIISDIHSVDVEIRKAILEENNHCPISNLINTPIDGYLPYPMDIFDPEYYQQAYSTSVKTLKPQNISNDNNDFIFEALNKDDMTFEFFRCSSSELKFFTYFHPCSKLTRCPVSVDMLQAAVRTSAEWNPKHSLCHFRRTLHFTDIEPPRIFILGGSVSAGTLSEGCCCAAEYDKKCVSVPITLEGNIPKSDQCIYSENDNRLGYQNACRWPTFFLRWIRSLSIDKVWTYPFVYGGIDSEIRSNTLYDHMRASGVKSFRKNDIILIDHSVNDALQNVYKGKKIQHGLQLLVRHIFSLSDIDSWPSVIILANYPLAKTYDGLGFDYYSHAYRRVARHWQLPLWSYRDAVWDVQATNHSQISRAMPYLRWERNDPWLNQFHPPWFVSLFYADMIGSLLLQEFHKCHVEGGLSTATRNASEMKIHLYDNFHMEVAYECNHNIPPILHHSAERYSQQQQDHAIVNNRSLYNILVYPLGSWPIVIQRSNKIAWVDADSNHNSTVACEESNYSSTISFGFSMDVLHKSLTGNDSIYIEISYLKTYFDAGKHRRLRSTSNLELFRFPIVGVIDVFVCGKYLGSVDALWDEYYNGIYHNSVMQFAGFVYPMANLSILCMTDSRIELRRLCKNGTSFGTTIKHSLNLPARASLKFVLFTIKACVLKVTQV